MFFTMKHGQHEFHTTNRIAQFISKMNSIYIPPELKSKRSDIKVILSKRPPTIYFKSYTINLSNDAVDPESLTEQQFMALLHFCTEKEIYLGATIKLKGKTGHCLVIAYYLDGILMIKNSWGHRRNSILTV